MSTEIHNVEEIANTQANLIANLDDGQIAIETDTNSGAGSLAFKNGANYVVANAQKYWDGASWVLIPQTLGDITCEDVIANDVTVMGDLTLNFGVEGSAVFAVDGDAIGITGADEINLRNANLTVGNITMTDDSEIASTGVSITMGASDITLTANNTVVTGDIYTVPFTDYSSTSTIVGWSSYAIKTIKYKKIGKTVILYYCIDGTSNSTATSITLPFAPVQAFRACVPRIRDNTTEENPGTSVADTDSSCVFKRTLENATWTASGTKTITGQFIYEVA